MSRAIYETDADLTREQDVVRVLEERWKARACKLARSYSLDYCFVREGKTAVSFCEIKVRKQSWEELHRLGGFFVALHKWNAAKQWCEISELPFIMAVKADGDLRFARIAPNLFKEHEGVIWKGREDRNDPADVEPLVLLAVNRFRSI